MEDLQENGYNVLALSFCSLTIRTWGIVESERLTSDKHFVRVMSKINPKKDCYGLLVFASRPFAV